MKIQTRSINWPNQMSGQVHTLAIGLYSFVSLGSLIFKICSNLTRWFDNRGRAFLLESHTVGHRRVVTIFDHIFRAQKTDEP